MLCGFGIPNEFFWRIEIFVREQESFGAYITVRR